MRLLTWNDHNELILTKSLDRNEIPPYAILSHTWGADSDEVDFTDLQQGRAKNKMGYKKIQFCSEQAQKDQIKHFWIDTCCINKADSAELSEAINSMYRWYRGAEKCYVYLSDVPTEATDNDGSDSSSSGKSSLRTSRWFTRGWTLQELLAPRVVEFFSNDGTLLGTKRTMAEQIHKITTLPLAALYGAAPAQFSIAERWRWAQKRQTKRLEDRAYCLFGIFDVFMPLIYGEGDHAFIRLEKAVNARSRVSTGYPVNDNHTIEAPDSHPSPAQAQHVQRDNAYSQRATRQRRMDQVETCAAQSLKQPNGEGWNDNGKKYETLLNSLLFDRIGFRVNNVKKALLSTCEWLLCHPYFETWSQNKNSDHHSGFLWIKGKPGCGKSTLMKAALEWSQKMKMKDDAPHAIIPYFFNARASASLEKSALGLYRTTVYHLLSTYDSLRPLFMNRFALKDAGSLGENWTSEELQEFLYDSVESRKSFTLSLFIDALDEAEYERDVRQMISFLTRLSDRASAADGACKLRVCLSSRHYPHISIGRGLSLIVEDQPEHGRDIEIYINKQLTCLNGPEKDILRACILQKSARIFLWVVLVVEMLNQLDDHGAPLSDMQARLETIPADLNELFRDILLKNSHGMRTTVLLFQFLVFSMRPLEPAELFVAVEYSQSKAHADGVPPTLVVPSPDRLARYILNYSHGLAEVVGGVVQFIHETIREFLVKDNVLPSIVPALSTNLVGISHETLRVACLRCITANSLPNDYQSWSDSILGCNASRKRLESNMLSRSPFLKYAISYILSHADQAQMHGVSQREFLKSQVDNDGIWLDSCRFRWTMIEYYPSSSTARGVTLLYFVLKRQYFSLVPILLDLSNAVNRRPGNHEPVLHLASMEGYLQIVQMLLDAGAEVDARGGWYAYALLAASARGHEPVVQALLRAGADISIRNGLDDNALLLASASGHEKVVRVLLEAGAEVEAHNKKYGSALQAASAGGHEKAVRVLLEAGADVHAKGGRFGGALQAASACGHVKVIQLLKSGPRNGRPQYRR